MAFEIINLQGYTFEVDHSSFVVPEGFPQGPGRPVTGDTIEVHKVQFIDAVYTPAGDMVGIRKVYEVELDDRQRDEFVRQLQGGEPEKRAPVLAVASAEALRHLPPLHNKQGGA